MMFRPVQGTAQISRDRFLDHGFRDPDRGLDHLALPGHCPGGRAAAAGSDQGGTASDQCAAMAISMFGYGCALTTDFIIQGAPGITAKAAGSRRRRDVMWKSLPMLIVWAAIALPLSFRSVRKDLKANARQTHRMGPFRGHRPRPRQKGRNGPRRHPGFKKMRPPDHRPSLCLDIVAMLVFKLRGGDATALLGGTVGIIMVFVASGSTARRALKNCPIIPGRGFMFGVAFSPRSF